SRLHHLLSLNLSDHFGVDAFITEECWHHLRPSAEDINRPQVYRRGEFLLVLFGQGDEFYHRLPFAVFWLNHFTKMRRAEAVFSKDGLSFRCQCELNKCFSNITHTVFIDVGIHHSNRVFNQNSRGWINHLITRTPREDSGVVFVFVSRRYITNAALEGKETLTPIRIHDAD